MVKSVLAPKYRLVIKLLRWLGLSAIVGMLAGSASALLLVALNWATSFREAHRWIIALLPLAGFLVGLLYHALGRQVEAGNDLILEEIHKEEADPRTTIPLRMTPFILAATLLTHIFGGSAGREGTAVQTGASLADQIARLFRLSPADRRLVLMAGVSAGFASVFGTPLAGAVFGLEVLSLGELSYEALVPCTLAAFAGDLTTRAWHIHHTASTVPQTPSVSLGTLLCAVAAGICFGLTAFLFVRLTHQLSNFARARISYPPARPLLGGVLISAAVFATGSTRYIGLGIPTIIGAFERRLPWWDFAGKIVFTVVTLGFGFKGGEVTPLFFIGATLGNALAPILPLPFPLLAAMGFVAVFAGAAKTPIASTLMAIELFGSEAGAFCAIACVISYYFSGDQGIYRAQRIKQIKGL